MALQTFTAGQVLTAAQVTALQANDYNQTVSNKTDSYTLVAADKGTRVVMNKATATTITVNTSLFAAGDTLWIHNIGAGVCTITAGTATVSTSGSLALAQNSGGTLYFTSTGVAIFFPTVAASAQGLTLLSTTSFSGVSSASAPANTFSSTYTDYLIKCNLTLSASTTLRFRMRAAGSDATGSNYTTQYLYGTGATVGAANTTEAMGYLAVVDASGRTTIDTVLYNPNLAANTFNLSKFLTSALSVGFCGVSHGVATAYDSITILPGSGTITGDMAIYGLAK